MGVREIAKALKRNPSTISRELKRNGYESNGMYHPTTAQNKYIKRREKCHRYIQLDNEVKCYIESKIEIRWSPEQISRREQSSINWMPSFSSIYRYIHKGLIINGNMTKLRRKGKFKRPAETRGKFNDGGRTIKKRPKHVYKREEIGHWEADTVESGRIGHQRKSNYCFVTLAERKSRYYIAILLPDRKEEKVTAAIIEALKEYPRELVKTITFDRGKEFAGYEKIEKELKCATYFCDPYCAWQKGTNENTNGLLREFYQKGMDLSKVDKEELNDNILMMNNRPRKCIGFKTPNEVIFE